MFAYEAILGVAYNINQMVRFQIEGRYLGTTSPGVNVAGLGYVTAPNQNIGVGAGVL